MRYGLIGTCYNAGISHIASGFAEHMNMKALLVDNKPFAKFPERFQVHRITKQITKEDIDWLLSDIDLLFTIETPYEWGVYAEAKKRGIKTVLMPMIEWLNRGQGELKNVDLFVCPSTATYEVVKAPNKILVTSEVPVDLSKFKPRVISKAKTFLHNSGHGGIKGRNSTAELMEAIPLVKSDVKFIINSQYPLNRINDPRITYNEQNYENYWEMYDEGDVWIMPGKYGVAYLGIQEAWASGMPVMFSDMPPFNEYIPKELLITPKSLEQVTFHAGQKELHAFQDPKLIAEAIDRVANLDLKPFSEKALDMAYEWSWDVWKEKYTNIFENL